MRLIFNLIAHPNPIMLKNSQELAQYLLDQEGSKRYINKKWLKVEKNSMKKLPPKPKRSEFS
jgi:hypothetical protein